MTEHLQDTDERRGDLITFATERLIAAEADLIDAAGAADDARRLLAELRRVAADLPAGIDLDVDRFLQSDEVTVATRKALIRRVVGGSEDDS